MPEIGGDWVDDGEWIHRRLIPRDCTVSLDNPPLFSWADSPQKMPGAAAYRIQLQAASGQSLTAISPSPRLMWPEPLAAGDYLWHVDVKTANGWVSSRERRFRIQSDRPEPCLIAGGAQALKRVLSHQRPRMLPSGASWESLRTSWGGPRAAEFARFERSVVAQLSQPLREDDVYGPQVVVNEALGWRYTGHARWLNSAREKLLQIAAWDPLGATSEANDDQRNRAVYLALARCLDLMGDQLSAAQRSLVVSAALQRLEQYVVRSGTQAVFDDIPYRSHAANSMHYAVEAMALLAGESPAFDEMLISLWDLYRTAYPAWGAQDGGDGNGTVYGWLNLMQPPQTWLVLKEATGVDFACRAFARRAGLQPVYLTPPVSADTTTRWGGPWPPFGDGAEAAYAPLATALADREFRLYAALVPASEEATLYRWYVGRMQAAQPRTADADFHGAVLGLLLLAPGIPDVTVTSAPKAAPIMAFTETGVVAMHSDLQDDQRISLFFQSGRFGSFNHSRAEQNAFVITVAGEPLLIGAGAYGGSAGSRRYARRTESKNTITFDGGKGQAEDANGQPEDSMEFRGELVAVNTTGSASSATGEARLAYQQRNPATGQITPLLSEAVRSVALLRTQKTIVVYDRVRSDTPRRWEWNLHALEPFVLRGDDVTVGNSAGPSACLHLYGTPTSFSQVAEATPALNAQRKAAWHGRFSAVTASKEAVFIAVIRLGCAPVMLDVDVDETKGRVRLQTHAQEASAVTFQDASTTWEGQWP